IVLDHNAAVNHQACIGCHQGAMGINDGEVIAVLSSRLSTTNDFVALRKQLLFTSLGGLAGLLLMILITWSIFGRLVARPISKIATVLSGLASDQVVDVPY